MLREKGPGLKILWLWTIGTAAILVTNVVRTRLRDMEQLMNAEIQQQSEPSDSVLVDSAPENDEGVDRELKS